MWRNLRLSGMASSTRVADVLILLGIPVAVGVLGAIFRNRKRETSGTEVGGDDRRFMIQAEP